MFVRDLRLCSKVSLAVVDEVHVRSYAPTGVVQLRAENTRLTAELAEHNCTITKLKGIEEDLRADVLKSATGPGGQEGSISWGN